LAAAVSRGQAIIPLFILDDEDAGHWAAGGASRWWLHGSLEALSDALKRRGTQLVLRRGKAEAVIDRTVQQTGATAVYWNRRYEPWARARNERLKSQLTERGIDAKSFNTSRICRGGCRARSRP
jgi:deoxyribodipyrimidine photo-lyase